MLRSKELYELRGKLFRCMSKHNEELPFYDDTREINHAELNYSNYIEVCEIYSEYVEGLKSKETYKKLGKYLDAFNTLDLFVIGSKENTQVVTSNAENEFTFRNKMKSVINVAGVCALGLSNIVIDKDIGEICEKYKDLLFRLVFEDMEKIEKPNYLCELDGNEPLFGYPKVFSSPSNMFFAWREEEQYLMEVARYLIEYLINEYKDRGKKFNATEIKKLLNTKIRTVGIYSLYDL